MSDKGKELKFIGFFPSLRSIRATRGYWNCYPANNGFRNHRLFDELVPVISVESNKISSCEMDEKSDNNSLSRCARLCLTKFNCTFSTDRRFLLSNPPVCYSWVCYYFSISFCPDIHLSSCVYNTMRERYIFSDWTMTTFILKRQ